MAKNKRNRTLVGDLIDITIGATLIGPATEIIGAANIPAPLKSGTTSLIATGLLVESAKPLKKEKKEFF